MLYSKPVLLILLIAILFVGRAAWSMFAKSQETEENLARAQRELSELQSRAAHLESELEKFEREDGVETEIRERFNVAKEGEGVIILYDEQRDEEEANTDRNRPWWKRFFDIF